MGLYVHIIYTDFYLQYLEDLMELGVLLVLGCNTGLTIKGTAVNEK